MTKQEKLIIWYTQRLEKVKAAYAGDCRKEEYIAAAEKDLEEKIESGELVEVPKEVVVYTPGVVLAPEERAEEMRLANEERKQVVREFAEKLRDKEFSAKIGSEWVAVVKSLDIDELAKEV